MLRLNASSGSIPLINRSIFWIWRSYKSGCGAKTKTSKPPPPFEHVSKLKGSAAQVAKESSASGIASIDLVTADDILGADGNLQRAFVLDRYGAGPAAFGA
jgi:hypothetical protein